jgi:hypothetical protein
LRFFFGVFVEVLCFLLCASLFVSLLSHAADEANLPTVS